MFITTHLIYFKTPSPVCKDCSTNQTLPQYKCLKNSQRTRTGYEPTDRSSMILMSFVVFSLKLATLSPASLPKLTHKDKSKEQKHVLMICVLCISRMTLGTCGVCVWRVEDVQCWPDTGVKPIIGSLLIIYINCEHWSPGTRVMLLKTGDKQVLISTICVENSDGKRYLLKH